MKVQKYKVIEDIHTKKRHVVDWDAEVSEELFVEIPATHYYSNDYVVIAERVLTNVFASDTPDAAQLVALMRQAGIEGSKIYEVARLYGDLA